MSNKPTEYRAYEYTGDSLVYSIIEVDEILADKDKEIARQNTEIKEAVKTMKSLEAEIIEFKEKLDKAIAERDGNQVCIDALKKYIYRLKEEKAQLKDKLEQEQLLRSHWNEDDYAMVNELERLSNENDKLKQKLESVQASMYADVVDANMENRRLKRALWLARAERAEARKNYWYARSCHEGDDFLVSIDGSPVKYIGCIKRTNYDWLLTWSEVESKCRAKAEGYK